MTLVPNPKKVYIRVDGGGWSPGADTVLYLPLNSTYTYTDQSGNSRTTTNNGVTFGTYQGVDCGYFYNKNIQVTPFQLPSDVTFLAWIYFIGYDEGDGKLFDARTSGDNNGIICGYDNSNGYKGTIIHSRSYYDVKVNYYTKNAWMLYAYTITNGSQHLYILGNNVNLTNSMSRSYSAFTPLYMNIGNEWNNGANRHFQGGISNFIIESKVRTSQEISDYFNQTKSLYGLS